MIFRFFLQSGEYQFFLRRLKNVVTTKRSLHQLRSNEVIINQRLEERSFVPPASLSIEEEAVQKPHAHLLEHARSYHQPVPNSMNRAEAQSKSMYQTPQKNGNKSAILIAQVEGSEQRLMGLSKAGSSVNSSVKEPSQGGMRGGSMPNRQPFAPWSAILNQRDGFKFRTLFCAKGPSPRKHKGRQPFSYGQALACF